MNKLLLAASELMELGNDYKDYEFAVAFGDQPLRWENSALSMVRFWDTKDRRSRRGF